MRVHIKSGRIRLFFGLPLSFVKSRLASKILTDASKPKSSSDSKHKRIETNDGIADETTICETVPVPVEGERKSDKMEMSRDANAEFVANREFLKKIYGALKKVVKGNGHFTFVDVSADNGKTKVKIKI